MKLRIAVAALVVALILLALPVMLAPALAASPEPVGCISAIWEDEDGTIHGPFVSCTVRCAGDANGDKVVNILDLSLQSAHYLQTVPPWTLGDVNGDGVVDILDLTITGDNYGHICAPVVIPGLAFD